MFHCSINSSMPGRFAAAGLEVAMYPTLLIPMIYVFLVMVVGPFAIFIRT